MSRQKAKGTAFETACVRYLRERLGDDRIERRALHGGRDMGDIFGLFAHGREGIVECKDVKNVGKALLDRFREQTVSERGNADADFALLVVHRVGVGAKRFGDNDCHMQVRDLERVMGGTFTCHAGESAKDMWVQASLETVCRWIMGNDGKET